MLFLPSKFCLLPLCCTKTDTTTRHDTHFCFEGHQSSCHEGGRFLQSSTSFSSRSLARERVAPSGMYSPCRQTNTQHNKHKPSSSECHVVSEDMSERGAGTSSFWTQSKVSHVPKLALTLTLNKKKGGTPWGTRMSTKGLAVLSSFSLQAAIPGGTPDSFKHIRRYASQKISAYCRMP